MKKVLVVLLILAMAFGAFAQINISGSVRSKLGYSNKASGWYGMNEGFNMQDDSSRIDLSGAWEGKAGVNAQLRVKSDSVIKLQHFWAWAKPADFMKLNLGWMDIGDYRVEDTTQTVAFGGEFKNTASSDPIGGAGKFFGALAQFYALDNNLNIGAALSSGSMAAEVKNADNMQVYVAVMYKLPNIGKIVVEGNANTTSSDFAEKMRASATFQFAPSAMFNLAATFKYAGIKATAYKYDTKDSYVAKRADPAMSVMLLGAYTGIKNLSINLAAEMFLSNGLLLAENVSVSYDFGFLKPVLYTIGLTTFDKDKRGVGAKNLDSIDNRVIGLELAIPIKVGKASFLAAGVAFDTGHEAFQIPAYFRLFF